MYNRTAEKKIKELLTMFPVVTVTGCRQCGKSTLLKNLLPDYKYVSLEDIDNRMDAEQDPRGFLKIYSTHTIIDEIQRVPSLLSYIQSHVDEVNEHGMYVLTGSHNLLLMQSVSQTLAGRTALFTMAPLSISEMRDADILPQTINELLYTGSFPRIYNEHINPTLFYSSYFQTYVERDVRQVQNVTELTAFSKFIKLCAGRIGQLLNITELAEAAEISRPTAEKWISVLETSYIIFRLQPFYANIEKRLVKSPKLYFYDTGLACYLLGITKPADIEQFYLRGALFENLIVSDFLKQRYFTGLESNLFFYRDKNNVEVDLITKEFQFLKAYEIKAGATRIQDFLKNIKLLVRNGILKNENCNIVYGGDQSLPATDEKPGFIPWNMI